MPARITLPGSTRLPVVKTVFASVFQPWSQGTGKTPTSLPWRLACKPGTAGRHGWYPRRADTPAQVTLLGSTRLPVVETMFASVLQPWSHGTGRHPCPFRGRCPATRARQAGRRGIDGEPTRRPG